MENALLVELSSRGCAIGERLAETYLGNEAFYVRMLKRLLENKGVAQLETALTIGDVKEVFSVSHELKGLYGTLGLTPLLTPIGEIVERSRRGSLDGVAEALVTLKELVWALEAVIREGETNA